ncbi:MAG TPA: MFS transporter [Candidatus Acidoferrum sp.]|nr:MFS transporter [Candidatus Acidoferrum sp.]
MTEAQAVTPAESGRPTKLLPASQLIRISLYWLGLASIFTGLGQINVGRLEFTGIVEKGHTGEALFLVNIVGALVAVAVQPTIGVISDYTTSRWGRRKPYILIGSILDVVFLIGIAQSNTLIAIAAFIVLLQLSSNFAQGPFQGYVPDLVPAQQVGTASALVGLMQILGNVVGFGVGAIAVATNQFALGLIALGVLELVTMLSVVIRVDDGVAALPRAGRSWLTIAKSAWGTDILRERSYVWLVASRLFILMAGSLLLTYVIPYLHRSLGLAQEETGGPQIVILILVAGGNLITIVPAARISDRVGRKPVIWVSCLIGAIGVGTVAVAPSVPVAIIGAALFGASAGMFLAVDWALMTDIIPKASSGRYMGISNLATGSAGTIAQLIGGAIVMDTVGRVFGDPIGPRATMGLAVVCYAIGALLLRPVDERRREDRPDAVIAVA